MFVPVLVPHQRCSKVVESSDGHANWGIDLGGPLWPRHEHTLRDSENAEVLTSQVWKYIFLLTHLWKQRYSWPIIQNRVLQKKKKCLPLVPEHENQHVIPSHKKKKKKNCNSKRNNCLSCKTFFFFFFVSVKIFLWHGSHTQKWLAT